MTEQTRRRARAFRKSLGKNIKKGLVAVGNIFKKLYGNKKSAIGFSVVLFFILMAIVGSLLPEAPVSGAKFESPSLQHPLGTDHLGRDLCLQIVAGSKDVLAIAFLTGVFTILIGVTLGLISGLIGGWVDRILQLVTNLFLTVPSFPILLVLSTMIVIKDNMTFALILSVWSWAGLCRAVRAQIISLKEREFIQICNVMGMKKSRIIASELMPNIASYIAVNFIQIMRGAITGSVGIMMLGLAALDSTNWGTMLYLIFQMGYLTNNKAVFYVLSPILCIVLFQFGIVMLANGVDEILNPRLRKN